MIKGCHSLKQKKNQNSLSINIMFYKNLKSQNLIITKAD